MSPDMFRDATPSTPIRVFTINEETKNDAQNLLQNVPDGNSIQKELIKIDFDKQTVSARALHDFLESTDRFSKWWQRMVSYGLAENVDFTTVKKFTVVNQGGKKEIGDYLLTIDAAKHIAMVQRSEKGKQARQYFIDVEKLYLKTLSNKPTEVTSISLLDKFLNLLVELESELGNQNANNLLVEKTVALEKQLAEQAALSIFKDEYLERTISKKIDMALKASFRETEQISGRDELVKMLPHATNHNNAVVLNQLQKNLQKTTLEEDLVRKCYRPAERKTENAIFLTATEITNHLESFSKRVIIRNVGMALKKLGFERMHCCINGNQLKGYYVITLF